LHLHQLLAQLEEALREAREARASLQAGLGAPPQGRDNATHSNGAAPASDVAAAPQVEAEAAGGADESGHMRDRSAPTRMHPENFYFDREPDFAALAERYPALRPFLVQPPLGERAASSGLRGKATNLARSRAALIVRCLCKPGRTRPARRPAAAPPRLSGVCEWSVQAGLRAAAGSYSHTVHHQRLVQALAQHTSLSSRLSLHHPLIHHIMNFMSTQPAEGNPIPSLSTPNPPTPCRRPPHPGLDELARHPRTDPHAAGR
jgi:hypothetical protein